MRTVREIMQPNVISVRSFLVSGRIHRALVVEDGRLVGIVTAFDILRVVAGDAAS